MQLTDEQRAVIQSRERKILVKAGAGTGKTEILTRRVIYLLENEPDLSLKDMVIITFTNKATDELRHRLKDHLYSRWRQEKDPRRKWRWRYELEGINSCQISTIHQFCLSLLNAYGPYHDGVNSYSPAFHIQTNLLHRAVEETVESWIHVQQSKNKKIVHFEYLPVYKFKQILKDAYQLLRNKGVEIDGVLNETDQSIIFETMRDVRFLKREIVHVLREIDRKYRQLKQIALDLEDLLEYSTKLLQKDPDFRKYVQRKYRYIFIDEFQDTSYYQSEMIKLICDDSPNSPALFVVGDIKQSIYAFRGADLGAYEKIEEWINKSGQTLSLSLNWRSTPEIVAFVNEVFERLSSRYKFRHEALKWRPFSQVINKNHAYQWIWRERELQPSAVVEWIKEQIEKKGRGYGDFCLLFRKNHEIPPFAEALKAAEIPVRVVDSGLFYNQPEIIETYRVLQFLCDPRHPIHREEAKRTFFFGNSDQRLDDFLRELQERHLVETLTPAQLLDFIYKETNVYEIVDYQQEANLNKLKEKARKINRLENIHLDQFCQWIHNMISSQQEEPLADVPEDNRQYVQLMTIHKAKGLQFPVVILPNLQQPISENALAPAVILDKENNRLEFKYQIDDHRKIQSAGYDEAVKRNKINTYQEEQRILYVALTRAKEFLLLLGAHNLPRSHECYQKWIMYG